MVGLGKRIIIDFMGFHPAMVHRPLEADFTLKIVAKKYIQLDLKVGIGMPDPRQVIPDPYIQIDFLFISRKDAASALSPFFTFPPGNSHNPPSNPSALRRVIRSLPLYCTTPTAI